MKKKRVTAGIVLFLLFGLIIVYGIKNRKPVKDSVDDSDSLEGQIAEEDGKLIYEKDGTPLLSETGIHFYEGQWRYIENGVWRNDVTGLVTCDESQYYVQNGLENWITSLVLENGIWYFVNNGKVDYDYTGLVLYGTSWWYVKDGILDWTYTGVCEHYGSWYYVIEGQLAWNYNGIVDYEGKQYMVENGKAYLQ